MYYNFTITGLSVAVALIVGTIELVSILHDKLQLADPVTGAITRLSLDNVGFLIAGTFVAVWAIAIGYWHLAKVEQRWGAVSDSGRE